VPYEWILGAMFVGTFAISPWMESFLARGLWLVIVGPLAGLALGVKAGRYSPPPRFGLLAWAAAAGWIWCLSIFLLAEAKSAFWRSRQGIERVIEILLHAWPVPVAPALVGLLVAAGMRGRYRELAVFANAAFLLFFAWGLDDVLSPVE